VTCSPENGQRGSGMIWKLWIAEAAEVEEANCYSRSENAGKCCWRRMDVRRKGFSSYSKEVGKS